VLVVPPLAEPLPDAPVAPPLAELAVAVASDDGPEQPLATETENARIDDMANDAPNLPTATLLSQ
jgi:hypothetical protein